MSTSAASHLSPSYPGRAPWGTASKLRAWQQGALEEYTRRQPARLPRGRDARRRQDDLRAAVAAELLGDRPVDTVTIVAPTEHLKTQWARGRHPCRHRIDPEYCERGRAAPRADFQGVAVTYAQVAAHPVLHMNRTEGRRTLVIFDEIHHAGDAK